MRRRDYFISHARLCIIVPTYNCYVHTYIYYIAVGLNIFYFILAVMSGEHDTRGIGYVFQSYLYRLQCMRCTK